MANAQINTVHTYSSARYEQTPPRQPDALFLSLPQGAMRAEIAATKTKVREFAQLDEGWDGYGAAKISAETLQNALNAIENVLQFAPAPDVIPNSNGTISFEWENSIGIGHLEIGKTKFSFYIKRQTGDPTLVDGLANQLSSNIGEKVAHLLYPELVSTNPITAIDIHGRLRNTYRNK